MFPVTMTLSFVVALQYVVRFCFFGWRHVSHNGPYGASNGSTVLSDVYMTLSQTVSPGSAPDVCQQTLLSTIALFVTSLTRPSGHGGWPGWVHQLWRSTVKSVIRLIVFVCWHFMQTVLLLLLLSYYSATLTLGGIALSALCCCDMTSIRLKCW